MGSLGTVMLAVLTVLTSMVSAALYITCLVWRRKALRRVRIRLILYNYVVVYQEVEVRQIPAMPDHLLVELGVRTIGSRLRIDPLPVILTGVSGFSFVDLDIGWRYRRTFRPW